jgi:hypothetical protein
MEHISRPVLDALLEWSNKYVLPTEDTIKLQPHPEQWDRGTEEKPLACTIAWELHALSYKIPVKSVRRKTLAYIFATYTREHRVPSRERVRYMFVYVSGNATILKLCVDLYLKYYPNELWDLCRDLAELPFRFRSMLTERLQQLEKSRIDRAGWHLKLE